MNEIEYRKAEQRLWESVGLEPTEQYADLARIGVRVRVQQVGEGPPVLFIHGGPNSGSTWAPIIEAFGGFRCFLVDRPGTGLSDPYPEVPTPEQFNELSDGFVPDVLDGLGLERGHVVASSLGGFMALRSAAARPDRFDRMVQMACPAMAPGMLVPQFMRLTSIKAFRRFTELFPPSPKINDNIMRQIGHGKSLDSGRIPQEFMDWYLGLQCHTDTMEHDGNLIGMAASFRGGFDPKLTLTDRTLSSITTPTLFLWGEDDGFGGREVADAVVGPMPKADLEMIENAGHLPWLDYPSEIGSRTRTFLTQER
jgi:pimeloyl-ACP methyl ester carboxylesterase